MRQVSSIKGQVSNNNQLSDRLLNFSKETVIYARHINSDHVSRPIITQLIKSATSIGANYSEAQNASSRKDFRNKIYIAKKEAQETLYWLQTIESYIASSNNIRILQSECRELIMILQIIANKLKDTE